MDFEPSKQLCVSSTGSSVPKQFSPGKISLFLDGMKRRAFTAGLQDVRLIHLSI